jgi:hypothetical protein
MNIILSIITIDFDLRKIFDSYFKTILLTKSLFNKLINY